MPLLRDRLDETKLRSIPFGDDRPDGGSSNQPYIQNPIDVNLGLNPGSKIYDVLGNDFLLRGGVLGAVNASTTDVIRLTKFFNPFARGASLNGALFVAKQAALERQNVDVRDGRSRTYLPTNTIAQAGVNAFGLHLDKDGLNPFKAGYYGGGDTGYFPVTLENETTDFDDGSHNRLQLLYQVKRLGLDSGNTTIQKRTFSLKKAFPKYFSENNLIQSLLSPLILPILPGYVFQESGFSNVGGTALETQGTLLPFTNRRLTTQKETVQVKLAANLYGITNANDDTNLISYGGGPGSFLGVGNTNIRIWNPLQFKNYYTETSSNIVKNELETSNPSLYLTPTDGNIVGAISVRESLLNTSKTSFARKRNGTDKILNPNLSISSDQVIPSDGDIIDFYFELINNNDITKNTKIPLRAYIDDFNDSFNGEWDSFRYMGRAENFYRYKGFTRDFSLNFIIPTLSRTDLITNYQKLNALTWLTMPDYSDKGYIRGNLAYLTMGDYLDRAIIVMKSITFTPIMEMGFDINRDEEYNIIPVGEDLYTGQLPKGIKVACSITPLTQTTEVNSNGGVFYTPQRGEAFIGNRAHVIKDRPETIGKQYTPEKNTAAVFAATDPEQSKIFTNL
jgi:hypothetical protein